MVSLLWFVVLAQALAAVTGEVATSTGNEYLDKNGPKLFDGPFKYTLERRDVHGSKIKSVPTLGKRNDFFFAKNLKSVPRIGRRNDFFMKTATKSVPRIGRRDLAPAWMDTEAAPAWPWLRDDFSYLRKRSLYDENDYVKQLDLTRELMEPRLQAVVQDF